MKRKGISDFNKSIYKVCSVCGKQSSTVKERMLHDYINGEDDKVVCCEECYHSIIEDSLC